MLRVIHNGHHGRIGFAVFAWNQDNFPELVGWTIISSETDANEASGRIEMRLEVGVEVEARKVKLKQFGYQSFSTGRLTDLSQAVDHASELLVAAPFATSRSIINIIGEGKDNVGDGPAAARDRFINTGGTLNAMVPSNNAEMFSYYQTQVIGGPGAFVIRVHDFDTIADAMKRKFVNDLTVAISIGPFVAKKTVE